MNWCVSYQGNQAGSLRKGDKVMYLLGGSDLCGHCVRYMINKVKPAMKMQKINTNWELS